MFVFLLHHPRSCLGFRRIGVLFAFVCVFDGVLARRGYCFVFVVIVDVDVGMVVMIVLVGGVVVLLGRCDFVVFGVVVLVRVIVLVCVKWFVSRVCVVALPSNLFRHSEYVWFPCVFFGAFDGCVCMVLVFLFVDVCLMACSLVVVIVAFGVDVVDVVML